MPGGTDQTLRPFLWRSERFYPDTEIVSRTKEGTVRYTYSEYADRVRQLASALDAINITAGDRVATFCWNHHRHFEVYFAAVSMGAQLHTINPLLPVEHIRHIIEDAGDRVVFVDPSLLDAIEPAVESLADREERSSSGREGQSPSGNRPTAGDSRTQSGDREAQSASSSRAKPGDSVEQFVMMGENVPETELDPVTDYESFIGVHDPAFDWPPVNEDQPAGMCYTSGTTGKPKGVEYTQQMLWTHTMATQSPQGVPIADDDVVMPIVPMFHVNAWGIPFSATAGGAKHVYPGPSPDPGDIARLIENESVTLSAGVPTVWLGLREYMRDHDVDLSSLDRVVVGGSAAPESMVEWFGQHGVEVLHAWGMTEMAPIGTVSHLKHDLEAADEETKIDKRTKQGLVIPGLEFRVVDEAGERVPWDGEAFGELWVRGPWVTTEYFARPHATEEDFEDGWLKTGDVVTVDPEGYIEIVDRTKDVIKSGGEWISSVELENAIMGHDAVEEATVIGVEHDRWQERPIAFIVSDHEEGTVESEVLAMLAERFPKWWLPDDVVFIEEVPKTATGKFSKKDLREQYTNAAMFDGEPPEEAAPDIDQEG